MARLILILEFFITFLLSCSLSCISLAFDNRPLAAEPSPSSLGVTLVPLGGDIFRPPHGKAQPPQAIIACLALVEVEFFNYQGELSKGLLVVNRDLVTDIKKIFGLIKRIEYPIASARPINEFNWSDNESMQANNSSSYNFRKMVGSKNWSLHSTGEAVDINPFCNPYIKTSIDGSRSQTVVLPEGSVYNPGAQCALSMQNEKGRQIIEAFKSLGWKWGGDWIHSKDFQHFEKPRGDKSQFCN